VVKLVDNAQIDFIMGLAGKKLRIDNRKEFDGFREIEIEYNISKNAEGSARVRLGKTEVAAGIKMGVGEPFSDRPDEGVMMVNAELPPIASPDFESGPPREPTVELARVVDRGIRESKSIDLKKLCIKKGEKVWIVYIDLYVLNHTGNLFDAAALAAVAALNKTVFPKLDKDYNIQHGEFTDKKLKMEKLPISCTFAKIGGKMFIDPSLKEEEVMSARLTIGCSKDAVHSMQKGLQDGLTAAEVDKCVADAMKQSAKIRKLLK
jgi:exosome complex component RRP42